MDLEIRKITDIDSDTLNKITEWMYHWWGKEDGYTLEAVKCRMKHSIQKERLPQTYGLFLDNEMIGMYQFTLEDLFVRPDIYPWLACVYIDGNYRNKGYGKILLESVKSMAQENLKSDEIYLYTKHVGLYEKFGWEFVSEINRFKKEAITERLYRLSLKKE